MKRFSLFGIGVLTLLGLSVLNPVVKADEYDHKTIISISQPLEVPGVVLPPGKYVMRLFNSSSNRHIVQFMNEDQNRQMALTFAIAAERIRPTGKTVLAMYEGSQGAPPALRTWYYPGDNVGQEFLYPHRQAVRISERTKTAVPEIETGKPAEVAAAEPAEKETHSETLIARAEPAPEPIPEPAPAPVAAPEPQPEPQQPAAEPQSPPAAAPPVETAAAAATSDSLPQTAGYGPLAALIGSLSLILAFGIRKLRSSRIL